MELTACSKPVSKNGEGIIMTGTSSMSFRVHDAKATAINAKYTSNLLIISEINYNYICKFLFLYQHT